MSDEELLAGVAAGDQRAFAQFYDRHAPRVLGLLVRTLRHRVDAEDVLQETFWHVWRNAAQYDPRRATPEVWLFLIARSRSLDFLRLRRRTTAGATAPSTAPASASATDPLQIVVRDETGQRVREAMGRLPEEQRSALCLAFYGGWTHEQVAAHQSIPLGTAKTRIWLGMKRLRTLLGDERKVRAR